MLKRDSELSVDGRKIHERLREAVSDCGSSNRLKTERRRTTTSLSRRGSAAGTLVGLQMSE